MKHKVIKDYQHITADKRVVLIKAKSLIENYKVNIKGDIYKLDKDVIDANPELFLEIDWKADLLDYMKGNKVPSPAIVAKKLIPYIENTYLSKVKTETKIETKIVEKIIQTDNTALDAEISKRQQLLDEVALTLSSRSNNLDNKEAELKQNERLYIEAKTQNEDRDHKLDLQEKDIAARKIEVQKLEKILSERQSLLGNRNKSEQTYQNQLELKIKEYEDKLSQVDEQLEKYRIDKALSLDEFKSLLQLAGEKYMSSHDEYWRQLVDKTGWCFNQNGLFR
jgi:hypothetical protein